METLNSDVGKIVLIPFALIGVVYVLSYLLTFLSGFYARIIRPGKNLKKNYGSWAIVTGATDGIGLAMAKEFAFKGLNIFLISRTKSKLVECAEEIKKLVGVEIRTLDIDFSNFNEQQRIRVTDEIKDLDIGVLVNNVGVSYPFTKYFHELTDAEVQALITLNIESTTWMTRIVLPGMLSRARGAIVNIGSGIPFEGASNFVIFDRFLFRLNFQLLESRTHPFWLNMVPRKVISLCFLVHLMPN
jgi:17beta-estradiol 17-dehydrogenase / very-long-chain 3-oxoacyl-CoA reductase